MGTKEKIPYYVMIYKWNHIAVWQNGNASFNKVVLHIVKKSWGKKLEHNPWYW